MKDQEENLTANKGGFIERLANQLGITANAKHIYAQPVERDGVTVIPVAKAAYAFGGGSGKNKGEEGSGGGGGVSISPVGYIEMKNGETRFCQTHDWFALLPLIAAATPMIFLSIWAVMKLLNGKK